MRVRVKVVEVVDIEMVERVVEVEVEVRWR